MKKHQMSLLFKAGLFMFALMFAFSACKKDDDDDPPAALIEDGLYIKGAATPYDQLNNDAMMVAGINEVGQAARTGMYEKYSTLKAGSTFEIVEVEGATQTTYGPATSDTMTLAGQNDQIKALIQKGTLGNSGTFSVDADGMYHIIVDMNTNTFIIAPVTHWAILGGSTELGWSDTELAQKGAFDPNSMTWEATGLTLRKGNFKFRHSGGWKLEIAGDSVKANTNFGGVTSGSGSNLTTTLVAGGPDYLLTEEQEGVYTVTITWTAEDGYTSSLVKTGTVVPLDYPEKLYMIGSAIGGWDWATNAIEMIPVHSKSHLFWKIVWLDAEATESAIKFNDTLDDSDEFGKAGDITDEIYPIGTENIPVPGASGYYMVTVNFETEEIAITQPLVYIIGDPVGGYDEQLEANLFTVDNASQYITLTKELVANGDLRLYAWMDKGWFTDWWQSEFMIFDGVIEYRATGEDQARIPATAGNITINLNFKDDTGSIVQ